MSERRTRGQALVETALILPLIVLILLLGIDLGRVFFVTIDLRNAAHEVTMLGGTTPEATCAEVKETVDTQMGRTGAPNAAVCAPLGATADVVYIAPTGFGCERVDPGVADLHAVDPKLPRRCRPEISRQAGASIPAGRPLRRIPDG